MNYDAIQGDVALDIKSGNLAPVASEKAMEQSKTDVERNMKIAPVVAEIDSRFIQAKDARSVQESIWLENTNQWRGVHAAEEQDSIRRARERNVYASSVYIKITKTKVTSALGQILDIIFDGDNIPIRIEPTPVPDGAAEQAFIAPEDFPMDSATVGEHAYGWGGDNKEIQPGATTKSVWGGAWDKFQEVLATKKVIKGRSPDPSKFPEISPAADAAMKMQKVILDQLEEGDFRTEVRSAAWENVVLGTAVLKGPETVKQVTHKWEKNPETQENQYSSLIKKFPQTRYASCWNIYPDPSARRQKELQYVIEKHLMNRISFSDLKNNLAFDTDAIDRLLFTGPLPRLMDSWETAIRDVMDTTTDDRYEVLEYWGYLERSMLESLNKFTGEDLTEGVDQFQVNIWKCQNEILRVIINPFVPQRIPYYFVPYEEHTQQLWGIAIPENMRDAQILMNNHQRMGIDNLALAGNCVFEVNENFITTGQDLTMYPGKIIRTNNGAPGQSIFALKFDNTYQSHMMAYDKARQIADEVTGQPSYSQGVASTTGATRTAAGMSMLMSAAAGNIRQVVKNWDEYCFNPLGEAYFNWNMQNNPDAEIKGDVRIVAGGTQALMRREVMSQRLLQYAQAVAPNPAIAPMVNWQYWNKELAKTMGLDPDKLTNDPVQAMLAAEMMGKAAGGGAPAGAPPEASQGPSAQDQTGGGGGNIGAGMATQPDESQFSGS